MGEYPMISGIERMALWFAGWTELTEEQQKAIYELSKALNISPLETFTHLKVIGKGPVEKAFPALWKMVEQDE